MATKLMDSGIRVFSINGKDQPLEAVNRVESLGWRAEAEKIMDDNIYDIILLEFHKISEAISTPSPPSYAYANTSP